ncbi:MAG: ABC transporter ATP-binding protein [Mariniblastus sp.]
MATPVIKCRDLTKSYGSAQVLRSVDFEIQPGKLVGFLGPNGAGKTTTVRILLGLLKPSSGEAQIFGQSCQRDGKSIRSQIGYLPGDVHLYSNLTGQRMLNFLAAARRIDCTSEIERIGKRLELDLTKKVRKYSTGMRQKLGLIQALMHKPKLLILDEPTSALDPLIRKTVFEELKLVVRDGRTVLFSSHSLSEVEELCDEVIILRSGQIVEQQTIEKLRGKALRRVKITFTLEDQMPISFPDDLVVISKDGTSLTGNWCGDIGSMTQWISEQAIDDLTIEQPDLNDLFLTYYQKQEEAK